MKIKIFFQRVEKVLEKIVQLVMSVIFIAVFFFVVSLSTYVSTVIYLYQKYGTKFTSEMISQHLPDVFLICLTFWLVVLVLYKRYMD